jgi:hypothetical protein
MGCCDTSASFLDAAYTKVSFLPKLSWKRKEASSKEERKLN